MTKGAFTKLWVSTLITLVLLVTGVSLAASWPINVNPPKDTQKDAPIKFGEGGTVTTVINLTDREITEGKVLVPVELENYNEDTQTKEIVYTFTLLWDEMPDSIGSAGDHPFVGDLTFNYEVVGVDESVKHLINVTVQNQSLEINYSEETEVTLEITLTIPATKEEYDLIKGKTIQIKLTFELKYKMRKSRGKK